MPKNWQNFAETYKFCFFLSRLSLLRLEKEGAFYWRDRMTVLQEDRQKYLAFIADQVKSLKCLDVDPQEVLWHYTTGEALVSIVETGTVYATQVSCLNDSTEVRYASKLLADAFLEIQQGNTVAAEETALIRDLVKGLAEGATPSSHASSVWFVACFSKQRDDLTQWRAYSVGENSYAIGFIAGGFFGRGSLVVRVNYDMEQHKQVVRDVAAATLRFFREGLDDNRASSSEAWGDEFIAEWGGLIGQLAPMLKDSAFSAEKEYRIVHQLQVSEMSHLRFKQKETLMARHLPLVFPPPAAATPSRVLPIGEVIIGPSRHKEITRVSVDSFMRQRGYTVPVSISEIPFQMT
jgi:hypothetical protein